jgi:asparagine synthetase B (glutamine-hydrolysing)
MHSIFLGYTASSESSDPTRAGHRAFRERAWALGLSVGFQDARHAVAVGRPSPAHLQTVHGAWRVVCFDGLLHCRAGLAMYGVRPDIMDDAEIVERLLEDYGTRALEWLIGDWAVAAIGPEGLLLATDYFGNRALFYHVDDDRAVIWSNYDWLLADYAERGDALDKVHFAGLLYFVPPPDRTPFQDVRAIPAGYMGIFGNGAPAVRPYWNPRRRRIELADSREYAQTFFELLREGVRERLAVPGRKWVEISGGVDSALVAACVSACVREDGRLGPVEAVHYTTERPETTGDTRRAREVAKQHGLSLRTFSHEQLLAKSAAASIEDPREPLGAFREVTRLGYREDVRVLLSGRLGDLLTGNREPEPALLADLALAGDVRQMLRSLYEWAVFTEVPVWHVLGRLVRDRLFPRREARLFAKFAQARETASTASTALPLLAASLDEAIAAWQVFLDWPGRSALSHADLWWWFPAHTMRMSGSYRGAGIFPPLIGPTPSLIARCWSTSLRAPGRRLSVRRSRADWCIGTSIGSCRPRSSVTFSSPTPRLGASLLFGISGCRHSRSRPLSIRSCSSSN